MQRGIEAFGQWQRRPYPAFRMAQDHGEGVVQRLVLAGQVEPEESTRDGIERHPHHLRHDFDHPVRFAVPAVQHIAGGTRDGGDRKSVVKGKSVSVRVDLGGRRIIKKKNKISRNRTPPIIKSEMLIRHRILKTTVERWDGSQGRLRDRSYI